MTATGYKQRFFVPDLSPMDRKDLAGVRVLCVFVAESPHSSEVEPEAVQERRPLCGSAGKRWWSKLGEIVEAGGARYACKDGEASDDVSLSRMLRFCRENRIAVINAVQYPLDPKIATQYPDADPAKNLGFAKLTGPQGYRKSPKAAQAVQDLRARLMSPALSEAVIVPLGGDADWFVARALGRETYSTRVWGKCHHPSAWWRRGGLFGRVAEERLRELFSGVLRDR